MSNPYTTAILVFAKEPIPGKVKTRLAATLPDTYDNPKQFACDVYEVCLHELFPLLHTLGFPLLLFIPPESNTTYFSRFLTTSIHIQQGNTLGERMHQAFLKGFTHYERLLLIGSDLPQLKRETLLTAQSALEKHDCTLGPAMDGGYYLIGFTKKGFTNCFENVEWSTNKVLFQTLALLKNHTVYLLEKYRDIDTNADLNDLFSSEDCPKGLKEFLHSQGYCSSDSPKNK